MAGAKNVALKAFASAILTDEEVVIHNVPLIADVHCMPRCSHKPWDKSGYQRSYCSHTEQVAKSTTVPLDVGARLRTSSLVAGPLLARYGAARIPNPGGCRIGARPIDRYIRGLAEMGAEISYHPDDGYFYLRADTLHGAGFEFEKIRTPVPKR